MAPPTGILKRNYIWMSPSRYTQHHFYTKEPDSKAIQKSEAKRKMFQKSFVAFILRKKENRFGKLCQD